MTLRSRTCERLALTDEGYDNYVRSTAGRVAFNCTLIIPVMAAFLLICDVMGDNSYDFDISVWVYAAILCVSAALSYAVYLWSYDRSYTDVYRESANVRTAIAERLRKLPMSFFEKKDPTDITERIMGDVTQQEQAMSEWFPLMASAMIFVGAMSAAILLFNPLLGAAALWPVPISIAMVFLSKRVQNKYNNRKSKALLEVNEGIQEYLENLCDLRTNGAGEDYLAGLNRKMDKAEKSQISAELAVSVFVVAAQLLLKFGIVTTAAVGGWMLTEGSVSVYVFIGYIILVGRVYDPLDQALQMLAAINSAEYNISRLKEVRDLPEQTGRQDFSPDGHTVSFEDVGFSYESGNAALRHISFTAEQGTVTALVGPSGSGKSTAAKLAARFWDIDSGRIALGGTDISEIDPETLLSHYSIVFQDVVLFNTTVRDNIRVGRRNATDEEIETAAEAAACGEFISRLPEGYDAVIGENGAKLSGGERQRISIARALLKNAPVILLDEATASLDAECESQVQRAISALIKDKTVLVVAHRMRTVRNADWIVVLSDGEIAEQGTPGDLLARNGIFAGMAELQSSSGSWKIGSADGA